MTWWSGFSPPRPAPVHSQLGYQGRRREREQGRLERNAPNDSEPIPNLTFRNRSTHFYNSPTTQPRGISRIGIDVERQAFEELFARFQVFNGLDWGQTFWVGGKLESEIGKVSRGRMRWICFSDEVSTRAEDRGVRWRGRVRVRTTCGSNAIPMTFRVNEHDFFPNHLTDGNLLHAREETAVCGERGKECQLVSLQRVTGERDTYSRVCDGCQEYEPVVRDDGRRPCRTGPEGREASSASHSSTLYTCSAADTK